MYDRQRGRYLVHQRRHCKAVMRLDLSDYSAGHRFGLSNGPGYELRLADGSCRQFFDVAPDSEFAGMLAEIMMLEKGPLSDDPGIIFSIKKNGAVPHPFMNRPGLQCRSYDDIGLCLWYQDCRPDVLFEITENHKYEIQFLIMQQALFPVYQKSITLGGLPLHAALAEFNKKGILLAGPSNSGKSTCSRRLPSSWRSICDDETLVVNDPEAAYQVHPFPTWSDYILKRGKPKWSVANPVPLSGIFFLKQAPQDKIVRLGKGESAVLINQAAMEVCDKYWRSFSIEEKKNATRETFANACSLANTVPCFRLCFSGDGTFWKEIETILHEQEKTR